MEMEDSSSLDPHSTILVKLHPSFPKDVFREVLCHDYISGSVE